MVHFKLLDRKTDDASVFQNSDGSIDETKKLNYTNWMGIPNPFYILEKGIRKHFRYIPGCPTFDPVQQEKEKYIFNMTAAKLGYSKGADIILDPELAAPLIEFLKIHPWNTSSPNHDPARHEAMFFTWDPKEDTKKEISLVKVQDEALDNLRYLSKNLEKMRSVALLFAETAGLSDDEEIYLGLRQVAQTRPEDFSASIANKENEVLSEVLKALNYNIIGKDAKAFFYEVDKAVMYPTTTKVDKAAKDELVTFLMSKEGDIHYRQLSIKIQQKELELRSPTGEIPSPKVE